MMSEILPWPVRDEGFLRFLQSNELIGLNSFIGLNNYLFLFVGPISPISPISLVSNKIKNIHIDFVAFFSVFSRAYLWALEPYGLMGLIGLKRIFTPYNPRNPSRATTRSNEFLGKFWKLVKSAKITTPGYLAGYQNEIESKKPSEININKTKRTRLSILGQDFRRLK